MGMRRRARRRGLVAGAVAGGAIAHHRAKQQEPAYDEGPVEAPPEVQYAPPPANPADQIEHLAQLHASGALSDEEFAAMKAKVLGS